MARKSYIIDSTVLLHDPNALVNFSGHDVIVPFSVLEELDKKSKFTDEHGRNALQILRLFTNAAEHADLFKGVKMNNDVHLFILREPYGDRQGFPLPLPPELPQNRILFAAYMMKKEKKNVTLITKDFVFRTKAHSIGIDAQNYTAVKDAYESMYKGIRRFELPKSDFDQLMVNGYLDTEDETYHPNEYAIVSSDGNSSLTTKYNAKTNRLESISSLKRDIWGLRPMNEEQECAMDLLLRDDIKLVTFIGQAGTGKTLLTLTAGLQKVFDEATYKKILVSRPIMPLGKDIGFLPGSKEEKIYHWMQPIYDNLEFLCENNAGEKGGQDAKNWILESEKIEMEAVTYIRGRSLANTYIIIDEAQNLTPHEAKTIISRAGKGTKVIMTGDPSQIDNPYLDKDSNALTYIVSRFKNHPIYGHINMLKTERSQLAAVAADVM